MNVSKFFGAVITVGIFTFVAKTNAQKFDPGKVTIEQLTQKRHAKDTSAAAAILFKKGKTSLEYRVGEGFLMITECTQRFKIYKKEGYEWANASIPYYTGKEDERVLIRDAATYNLVGGKIEKTKLRSDGEFIEKTNKLWSRKKIAMPNVREGAVIEFTYSVISPYFQNLPDWTFQETIPVDYAEMKTQIPDYFEYQVHMKGSIIPEVEKNTMPRRLSGKERVKNMRTGLMEDDFYDFSFNDKIATYVMRNVPALADEGFVNNISNYTASISHELASVKGFDGKTTLYANDWQSVTQKIYDNTDFGDELLRTGYFEQDLKAILANASDESQKLIAVYNSVRNNMNWDGMYGYQCDKGVRKAYTEKSGNVAEINLMLTAMLREAGIKANPVLVSTRSNGIALYPALTSFNFVVVQAEAGGKSVLLDATDKWAAPDVLPRRDLNWFGRLIRPDGTSELIDMMPKTKSRETVNILAGIEPEGKYSGQIRRQYFDHHSMWFRSANAKLSEDNYLEKLEKSHNGFEVDAYKRDMDGDASKPVSETFAFVHNGSVEVIGDRMYVSPLALLAMDSNPFHQQKRDYPVDFVYPHQEKINLSLTLPDGYAVESLPSVMNIAMPDNVGSFKFVAQAHNKSIQIIANYEMNEAIVPADYYDSLKDFYQKMIDKQHEKIILKKI